MAHYTTPTAHPTWREQAATATERACFMEAIAGRAARALQHGRPDAALALLSRAIQIEAKPFTLPRGRRLALVSPAVAVAVVQKDPQPPTNRGPGGERLPWCVAA